MDKKFISPISIDLGATNTGVIFSHYQAGESFDKIKKIARTYKLKKDAYTLLMTDRTAKRHQRRGLDRRQLVKRLFKLIWEKYFGLNFDKSTQQTISFLLNRRGFSFLTAEYDEEVLTMFPKEAFEFLPKDIKEEFDNNDNFDFANKLQEWNKDKDKLETFNKLLEEPKRIAKRQVVFSRSKKLREVCQQIINNEEVKENTKDRVKLSKTSKEIVKEWRDKGVKGLDKLSLDKYSIDLFAYLQDNKELVETILNTLPNYDDEQEKLKSSRWNFNPEKFDINKENIFGVDEPNIKNHLHHLCFALGKVLNELQSGGRHRSKYFGEVQSVLEEKKHKHNYLKEFCGNLQQGKFQKLNIEKLVNLIGHLSNLELKPLRKYFNNEKHKISKENEKGDFWNEQRLTKIFCQWVINEWRVNPSKDIEKKEDAPYDYKKLREEVLPLKETEKVIDYFFKE